MAESTPIIDPALEALVRKRLTEDEIILAVDEQKPGRVVVTLISEELHRICKPAVERFGRGGGTGRTLSFKRRGNHWKYCGEGFWIE